MTGLVPIAETRAQSQEKYVVSDEPRTAISAAESADSGAAATGGQARQELLEIDKKVLLECIKLARFRAYYNEATNRTGFWRSWMYPIEQEAGTALAFANTLTDLSQRARGLQNPALISHPSQKRGLTCAVIGQSISGTSSLIELAYNGHIAWQARRQRFSPRKSEASVADMLHTIDELLDRREKLLRANDTMENAQALELQGKLLSQIRNQLLYGFKQFSILSRETEWSENTFYAIDAVQNFTQMTSSILAFRGFSRSTFFGGSAITGLVSNTLAMANPLIRTFAGRCVARYQERRLSRIFPQQKLRTMDELVNDWSELNQIVAGKPTFTTDMSVLKELSFLTARSQEADLVLAREQKKMRELRRVADQQAISGPIIGTLGVAQSTCAVVSYYGYRSRPVVDNRISFAGRIPQTVGQAYSLITTPRAKIQSIFYTRALAKKGELPRQIFEARLRHLADLEATIKAAKL